MIYLELFWVFFQMGLLGIGGGYAAIPLIKSYAVEGRGWLSTEQFADLLAIDELTPGPIAINSATFVGMQVGGILGAVIATLAYVFPAVIIISVLAFVYRKFRDLDGMKTVLKFLRPAVAAAIVSAALALVIMSLWDGNGFSTATVDLNIVSAFIFAASLYVLRKFKISPIFVILGSGVLGVVFYLLL